MSTTYAVAKLKVQKDLDLEGETFIQDTEMLEYFNEALREAEAEILGINEDYFMTRAYLALVNGTDLYSLPTGIYEDKIRGIVYDNTSATSGGSIYEIKRIRTPKKFLDRSYLRNSDPTDYYQYIVLNSSASGTQIELSPAAKETSSTNVRIWHLRVVDVIVNTTDIVDKDIRFINFIYAYVKARCKQKEAAGDMPQDARMELEMQRKLMVETLSNRIPDDDNEAIKDMSFYYEMS